MRTDPGKDRSFTHSKDWTREDGHLRLFDLQPDTSEGAMQTSSFSGHERNRLFMSDGGRDFSDASLVSGLDSKSDGRAMVLWDWDRDGWTDVAVVNANSPQLELFRNSMGDRLSQRKALAFRFVGANRDSRPATGQTSNRDGYGTKVWVHLDDQPVIFREHRCGEGFSAQNSSTMLVGIGDRELASKVVVQWPSGARQEAVNVSAGKLLVWREDGGESPHETLAYAPLQRRPRGVVNVDLPPCVLANDQLTTSSRLTLIVAMATWCTKCRSELPQLAYLRSLYSMEQLSMVGFPADRNESDEDFERYERIEQPPYKVLRQLSTNDRETLEQALSSALETQQLSIPAVLLIDASGQVISASQGVPDASWLAKSIASVIETPAAHKLNFGRSN